MINFYNGDHRYYCGVDLHKKKMYVFIIDVEGNGVHHKNIRTGREEFLAAIAPFRDNLVVAVECMFAWWTKMGNAHLKWAFSEAVLLLVRQSDEIKRQLARLESKHEKG